MHGPAVLSWLLALLTAATGALCLARLRRPPAGPTAAGHAGHGHGPGRESDAAEAAMGLGSAAMITLGDRLPPPLWAGLFGLLAVGFLLAAAARGPAGLRAHRLHHAVGALAMAYMALAMTAGVPHAHPGMAMPMGRPAVTGVLLLYFGGYALWAGSRLLTVPGPALVAGPGGTRATAAPGGGPAAGSGPGAPWLGGALPRACRLAMGVGMFAMLLVL
ncbi:hypothetical protein GCM10009665_76250 [Kitasatospora nipponensis]|uniref:DUF5134 domain-containing protein n=1 Tax=Kitasatospora nipponensis TaxID=258049 RepID=A0ABN1T7Z4_9ACTN